MDKYAESMTILAYMRFDEVEQWAHTVNTVSNETDRGEDYEAFKKTEGRKTDRPGAGEISRPPRRDQILLYRHALIVPRLHRQRRRLDVWHRQGLPQPAEDLHLAPHQDS